MKTFVICILSAIFMAMAVSCSGEKHHPYAFYYWRTKLSLHADEKKALEKSSAPYLYTRFFDVDKTDGKFMPLGVISKETGFVTGKKLVPVVFITNRTFINIRPEEITRLAESISGLVQKKALQYRLPVSSEIQIDCDWTTGTRNDYFSFLKELKKTSRKQVTCTLRLHQVKDKAIMGIPPVDTVYLMCYSTSSPLENSDKNSILDVALLKSYLARIDEYPIRTIEVALPIYSWGIVTNHLGKHKLINALSVKDLARPGFRRISGNEAEVLQDGFYFGSYLNKSFRIKIEVASDEQRKEVISFLDKKLPAFTVVYYQLDRKFLEGRTF